MNTLIDLFQTFNTRGEKHVFVYRTGIRRFTFSYQWLYETSLKMASWLESQGVEKGDRVVIWAPNSPWWGVAFWGTIARGAIVVPVDFMSGRDRAEKIVELTEAKIVLQSQYKIDKIMEQGTGNREQENKKEIVIPDAGLEIPETKNKKIEIIENLEYLLTNLSTKHYSLNTSSDDTAELIYTSGTTGDPKGVILTHKNLIANLTQINGHVPVVNEKWNFLSVLPLSHTFEQMAGFLTPLYRGGLIVYMRTLKPSAIMESFEKEDIYVMPIVPRLLQALKASVERELAGKHLDGVFRWLSQNHPKSFVFFPVKKKFGRHFQFFISGGAALPQDVFKFWDSMGFRVIEGYGITECSPVLTANTFEKQIIGSVGKPLPGVEIRIENSHSGAKRSVAIESTGSYRQSRDLLQDDKAEGEILAKGPNVFPGYYQNEEATKKTFTDDGWFKTGDNGYFDEKGNLYIKGRQKEMIVTGAGINVYPDDIEPVLNSIPGVKEACVIGKQTPEGEEVHAVLILTQIDVDKTHINTDQHTSPFGYSSQEEISKNPLSGGVDAKRTGWVEERAKHIIDQANAKLDTLQQITGFTIWHEKEFPKTSTMKVQKFKVKQTIESVETRDLVSLQSADKLVSIIATVTGKPSSDINEQSVLVSDLGLTSIARLELVNTLEQEFRLDMEDTAITQTTTVADVRKMIEKREKRKGNGAPRKWTDMLPVKIVRFIVDYAIHIPLLKIIVSLNKKGLENLNKVKGPVIFISNHISYIDPYVILWSLPHRFRYRVAPAAGDFLFFNKKSLIGTIVGRLMYEYASFFSMALLVGEQFAFRTTLMHMGKMIDRKNHILIFPEGERAWDGKLLPFQSGLGIMVKELQVPVVPIKISGLFEIWPRGKFIQRRGDATIVFGKPITFTNESTDEILRKSRQAIIEL